MEFDGWANENQGRSSNPALFLLPTHRISLSPSRPAAPVGERCSGGRIYRRAVPSQLLRCMGYTRSCSSRIMRFEHPRKACKKGVNLIGTCSSATLTTSKANAWGLPRLGSLRAGCATPGRRGLFFRLRLKQPPLERTSIGTPPGLPPRWRCFTGAHC